MKKGLEELKNLDSDLVASKAHIVQTTLEDIVNKRFDKLNPVKAKGLIKILEREFDLDLSDWMREFEAYHTIKEPEISTIDKLQVEAAKNEKKPISKITLGVLIATALVGAGYTLYLSQNSISPDANSSETLQAEANETNASLAFNIAFDENKSEQNRTAEANITDTNNSIAETNITKPAPISTAAPAVAQENFYVEPTKKVWIGIRYLDTNKSRWMEAVTEQKFDFNSSREQLISFGHAQVKIVAGGTTIESRAGGKIRYHYKNGKLREINEEEYNKLAGIAPKTDANATKPKN